MDRLGQVIALLVVGVDDDGCVLLSDFTGHGIHIPDDHMGRHTLSNQFIGRTIAANQLICSFQQIQALPGLRKQSVGQDNNFTIRFHLLAS